MIPAFILVLTLGTAPTDSQPTLVDFMLPAETVVTYPENPQLVQRSNPTLSPSAKEAYDTEFLTSSFFSAFALSKSGGFGYATTANTPSAARDIAMRQCLTVNDNCRVIAEIHPEGYVPPKAGEITVSTEVAELYADTVTYTAFRAMAISEDGAYSLVWGYDTQAEADSVAATDCERFRINDLPGLADYPCILLPAAQ